MQAEAIALLTQGGTSSLALAHTAPDSMSIHCKHGQHGSHEEQRVILERLQ